MATILVVDDNELNRQYLASLLRYKSHDVLEAEDGERGLALARLHHPALIIADIVMPRMDGYELVRQLRADTNVANTPVIFVSATYVEQEARALAQACGVEHLLMKPTEPQLIVETIAAALERGPIELATMPSATFHHEHLRLVTDRLAAKVSDLEAKVADLEDTRGRLRALSAYVERVRERERARIAREIHDELGQALTGLKMDLTWLAKRLDEADRSSLERVESMMALVDATSRTVRGIASELRPLVLDDLGLVAALEWLAAEVQTRSGIRCAFAAEPDEVALHVDRATAVFRIVQEALTNVMRHSGATEVKVRLRLEGAEPDRVLVVDVVDNGRGITEAQRSCSDSLGLLGMRERARTHEGEIAIEKAEGGGTSLELRLPLAG